MPRGLWLALVRCEVGFRQSRPCHFELVGRYPQPHGGNARSQSTLAMAGIRPKRNTTAGSQKATPACERGGYVPPLFSVHRLLSQRNFHTRRAASSTIRRESFDAPATRSVKMIGTSLTRAPQRSALQVVSIGKA